MGGVWSVCTFVTDRDACSDASLVMLGRVSLPMAPPLCANAAEVASRGATAAKAGSSPSADLSPRSPRISGQTSCRRRGSGVAWRHAMRWVERGQGCRGSARASRACGRWPWPWRRRCSVRPRAVWARRQRAGAWLRCSRSEVRWAFGVRGSTLTASMPAIGDRQHCPMGEVADSPGGQERRLTPDGRMAIAAGQGRAVGWVRSATLRRETADRPRKPR